MKKSITVIAVSLFFTSLATADEALVRQNCGKNINAPGYVECRARWINVVPVCSDRTKKCVAGHAD